MSKSAADRFADAIEVERQRLLADCTELDPRVLLLGVVRALDWSFVGRPREPLLDAEEAAVGLPVLLAAVPPGFVGRGGWPRLISNDSYELVMFAALARAGVISRCITLLATARAGFASVTDAERGVRVELAGRGIGLERFDVEDGDALLELASADDRAEWRRLQEHEPWIASTTSKLVRTWGDHFIRYDADPDLDELFERRGLIWCRTKMALQDTFDADARFDGVEFNTIRAVIGLLAGYALKHIAFCKSLLAKRPDLRPQNLLTIVTEPAALVDSIASHLDAPEMEGDIARALELLTWDADGDADLLAAGEAIPPLAKIGEGFVVRSIASTLSQSFQFSLRKMKARHRRDWDRNVNRRERSFQQDLATLFRARHRVVSKSRNLKKGRAVITDVDTAVYDPVHRCLALFQLKWQDPFGVNFAERGSRATNFVSAGNDWVRRVSIWVGEHSHEELQRALGLPLEPVDSLVLFVLGRTNATFSGPMNEDPRAAWGSWALLARLAVECARGNQLMRIHERLRSILTERVTSTPSSGFEEYRLGEFVVYAVSAGGEVGTSAG